MLKPEGEVVMKTQIIQTVKPINIVRRTGHTEIEEAVAAMNEDGYRVVTAFGIVAPSSRGFAGEDGGCKTESVVLVGELFER
jgi:hypothetical protein